MYCGGIIDKVNTETHLLLEPSVDKGKVHPITGHEGPKGSRGIALLFL
jgi:hypothetical protein